MAKLLVSWKNYSSCADCAYHLKRDLYTSFGYIIMGISINKYVAPYTTIWWVLAIGYLYALADHMYIRGGHFNATFKFQLAIPLIPFSIP